MRTLSRLYFGVNKGLNLSKIKRLSSVRRGLDNFCLETLQVARFQHRFSFNGPGLKDFLVNENSTEGVEVTNDPAELIPYLNEQDFNGCNRKVYFQVQGCQMNVSDTEIVWSILKKSGYQKTTELSDADVVLIMTCAIRDTAEVKIWSYIQNLKAIKKSGKKKHMKVGILGCMAERLKEKVLEIDKTVDLVAGPDSYKDLPRLLALTRNDEKAVNVLLSLDETYADIMPVRLDENEVTAYVSIMRGCDNMCTYCIVPFTRGRERSRPIDSILDEVKMLSERGVKQITLLGQNVNSYRDISCGVTKEPTKMSAGFKTVYKAKQGGLRFDVLLDKVSAVDPNMRIRFTAPHPKDFPDEVLHLIRERKNICCSLHMPAQSGSTAVLERMRRGYTREAYIELIDHVRKIIPNVSLCTDIISGFCGETEKDHEDTLDLLRSVKFNTVFHFLYSMREKTTAHRRYVDDVPLEVKKRRVAEVYEVFRPIAKRLNQAQIHQRQLVLVEGVSRKSELFLQGRNDGNIRVIIPNADTAASVDSNEMRPVKAGDYVAVHITDGNSQTLRGVPLYHTTLVDFDEAQISARDQNFSQNEEKVSL